MKIEPAVRIPEERVPEILTRAAELDRDRRETITVDAIRAAALDAGISASAVDAALAEYAQGEDVVLPTESVREKEPRFGRVRGFFRRAASALKSPLKLAGAFFVIGLTGAAGEGAVVIAALAWAFLTGRMVWKFRPARRARPFVLRLVLMTVALGLGFAVGEVDEDAIGVLFGFAVPALVAGCAIIKIRLPRRFRARGELQAGAS